MRTSGVAIFVHTARARVRGRRSSRSRLWPTKPRLAELTPALTSAAGRARARAHGHHPLRQWWQRPRPASRSHSRPPIPSGSCSVVHARPRAHARGRHPLRQRRPRPRPASPRARGCHPLVLTAAIPSCSRLPSPPTAASGRRSHEWDETNEGSQWEFHPVCNVLETVSAHSLLSPSSMIHAKSLFLLMWHPI
jgi:hypothetical protein